VVRGRSKRSKKKTAKSSKRTPGRVPERDFAALLVAHIESTGITKAELARAIQTRPQYIREIETRRKPPPTLDKVEILADALGLSGTPRDLFLARAREGRTKPESRKYFRNLEDAFSRLMDIFSVNADARNAVRKGKFNVLVDHIQDAFMDAGKVKSEKDFVPILQVLRYSAFLKELLEGLDTLREDHTSEDLDWVQTELLKQLERMVGLRKGEQEIFQKLARKRK